MHATTNKHHRQTKQTNTTDTAHIVRQTQQPHAHTTIASNHHTAVFNQTQTDRCSQKMHVRAGGKGANTTISRFKQAHTPVKLAPIHERAHTQHAGAAKPITNNIILRHTHEI